MNREVKCRKIQMPHSRFSSFCVSAEWNDWKEMYDPQFWPAGSVVRQYFEPRLPRNGGGRLPEGNASPRGGGELRSGAGELPAPSDTAVVVPAVDGETSSPAGNNTGRK